MKLVHFGSGNIGRGAIPEIFFPISKQIIFIDPNPQVVEKLNSIKSYNIKNKKNLLISNYKSININDIDEIALQIKNADVISTSCGFDNLKSIANILDNVSHLISKPINVICFENNIRPSSHLASLMKNTKNYFFVDCTIDRVIPKQEMIDDILDIVAEDYLDVIVEKANIINLEYFVNCKIVDDLTNFISLKLFAVNGLHYVIAILSFNAGLNFIFEGLANNKVYDQVLFYTKNLEYFLIKKYGFDEKYIHDYLTNNLKRFSSNLIQDECSRVARNSKLKLSLENRVIPIFKFFLENQEPIPSEDFIKLKNILINLYNYKNNFDDDSIEIQNFIKENGLSKAILKYSNIKIEI